MKNQVKLPEKYEDIILPMMAINNKLVLTGSLSLALLGLITLRDGDVDFSLTEKLTEDEFLGMKSLFDLKYSSWLTTKENDYGTEMAAGYKEPTTVQDMISSPYNIIRFIKTFNKDKPIVDKLNIDIFTEFFIEDKNIIFLEYEDWGVKIKLLHPSITIMKKALYAFNPTKVKEWRKHLIDIFYITSTPNNFVSFFEKMKIHEGEEHHAKNKTKILTEIDEINNILENKMSGIYERDEKIFRDYNMFCSKELYIKAYLDRVNFNF